MKELITANLDIWSAAVTAKTSGAGRGSGNKGAYGINKLRELILELAVRGKLVPQNSNDEPATELLKKIQKERERLIADGKIKQDKPLPSITDQEKPFDLPIGWDWVRLGDLMAAVTDGDHQAPPKADDGVPFLVIGNLNSGNITFDYCRYVPETYYENLDWIKRPSLGDLLYTVTGSYGIPIKVQTSDKFCVQRHVAILKATLATPVDYLLNVLKSKYALDYAASIATGIAQKTVPLTGLRSMTLAMPPASEQHRIVAKVDELMALCDQLETEQTNSSEAHEKLVSILLDALTQGDNFTESWARLQEHFNVLFTTPASIDKLKQTLLQLAVMGKLVPQDLNDEPASVLLKKLAVKCDQHNVTGWATVLLGRLGNIFGGATPSKSNPGYWSGRIPWVSPKDMKQNFIDDSEDHVSEAAVSSTSLKRIPIGSLLMVVRGMILVHSFPVAITRRVVTINQDMKALAVPNEIQAYLLLYLRANRKAFLSLVDRSTHGTCKIVSEKLWSYPVQLPPVAEQIRIVAKVDELMALCEQLKTHLIEAGEKQKKLADVMVERAVA